MLDRLLSALIAVVLGFLVWLYARSRDQEMLDNVTVPVAITLAAQQAEQYDLEVSGSAVVTASFSGPPSRIRELRGMLQRGELRVNKPLIVPDDRVGETRYLDTVRIDVSDLHAPPGVRSIVSEERNRIPVTLRRIVERRLPVRLDYAPEEPVAQITLEPATVLVRGPQEILDRVRALPTRPYFPPGRQGAASLKEFVSAGTVGLVEEVEGRPIRALPGSVGVRVTLKPQQRVYELVDVPIQFLCPASFPLRAAWEDERAGKITLKLLGPAGEEQPTLTAYIDLTRREFKQGLYADEPLRLQLPKDFQLAQAPPRSATFRLSPMQPERGAVPALGGSRAP